MRKAEYLSNTAPVCNITFRTKFQKQVGDDDKLLHRFEQTTYSIIHKDPSQALGILWLLTYNIVQGFETLSYRSITLDEAKNEDLSYYQQLTYLPENLTIPFRNELRYQYSKAHPDFEKLEIPDECKEAFSALSKLEMGNIIAIVVFNHIKYLLDFIPSKEIKRYIGLLRSPIERKISGGLKALGFSSIEANFLTPHSKKIADLLEVLNENNTHSNPKHIQHKTSKSPHNDSDIAGTTYIKLDLGDIPLELIAQYHTEIEDFIAKADKLKELGIDPIKLIKHSKSIKELLC